MTFDNTLRKVAFTSILSNTNTAIMVPQIKARFVRKITSCPICMPVSLFIGSFQQQPWMIKREGSSIKKFLQAVNGEADVEEQTK